MSESILKALMRLFAIIADVEIGENGEILNPGRVIVASYLKQQLNQELVDEYLALFDQYIAQHHSKKGKKRMSANSVKVLAICSRVNDELRQEQKMLVLLKLFEFINHESSITDEELEFVKTVAVTFNINQLEYENCKALILEEPDKIPYKQNLLLVDGNKDFSNSEVKHIYSEHITGQLVILHIESTNMYVFGYIGNEPFYLNSSSLSINEVKVTANRNEKQITIEKTKIMINKIN